MSNDFSHEQDDHELSSHSWRVLRPFLTMGMIVLLMVVVVGTIVTMNRLTNISPVLPAPTPFPGSNQFYFSVSPSWGTLTIDGHILSPTPEPGTGQLPLTLPTGTHHVVWQIAPFPTVQCLIFLPFRFSSQSCINSNIPQSFPAVHGHTVTAYLLNFDVSLASLPDTQFTALNTAIQMKLNQLQGTETMQAGEHYANSHYTTYNITTDTATTPLQATLSFLVVDAGHAQGPFGSCSAGDLLDSPENCSNQGQNCLLLCPVTETGTSSRKQWDVFVEIGMDWVYAPPNDPQHPMIADQIDPAAGGNTFLVALSVQWTGSQWQVSFYHNKQIDSSPLANPVCDAAQFVLGEDSRFLSVAGSTQNIALKFVSGTNPAAGCVMEAFAATAGGIPSSPHPLARCLYRFGVPLALDSEAHRSWPFLLQASTYEQGIAQQIIAQAHKA
jgi:hypothetical protein